MITPRNETLLRSILLCVGVSLFLSQCAFAQSPKMSGASGDAATTQQSRLGQPQMSQIADAAKQSATQLDPERIEDIEPTRQRLLDAVDELRRYLEQSSSVENAEAWIDYLEIDPVLQGIEAEESTAQLMRKAQRVVQKATGMHPGLEVNAVRKVRQAAEDFNNALRFSKKDQVLGSLAKLLEKSGAGWTEVDENPTQKELERLSLLLDLLHRTQQEVALVDQTQQTFSKPNFQLIVDESLIQRPINRRVSRNRPVQDCILGTRIVGDALMEGDITASLMPSVGTVRLQFSFVGGINSNNRGYNGPVRLRTTSYSQVHVTRMMTADEQGVQFGSVSTSATLQSQINAIEHPLGLVRRIARKKAAQQKPQADAIAKQRLIGRVSNEFAEETNKAADRPISEVFANAFAFLQRMNIEEPQRLMGSTEDSVYINATIRSGNQLAAPVAPPTVPAGYEATVQIHESLINNTIGAVLAGRTMNRDELARLAKKSGRTAEASDESESDPKQVKDFELDFHPLRPIIFEARDGKVNLGIRITRFKSDRRELKDQIEIVATYVPVTTEEDVVILEQESDTRITFLKTKGIRKSATWGAVKEGVADAFPTRLMDRPWTVPEDAKAKAIAGRTYRARYFDVQGGWVTLSVQ